ncbi:MAG: ComF family protein [Alphaproteobacteria bacterium]
MNFFKKFTQILFPNTCLACNVIISHDGEFCANCWKGLQFINHPKCQKCSFPFEFSVDFSSDCSVQNSEKICSNCLKKKPYYRKVYTIFRYNSTIGNAIANFKYRDQTFIAKRFVKLINKFTDIDLKSYDLITGVALHKKKLKTRKFNQAILLAKFLSKDKLIYDLIIRVKNDNSQVKLGQKQRVKNIKKAFMLNPKYKENKLIKNKKILLIDDVITTSSTINSISKILMRNKAKQVDVLAIAKTIFD